MKRGISTTTVQERWEDRPRLRPRYILTKSGADPVTFDNLYRLPELLVDAGVQPNVARVAALNIQRRLTSGDTAAWHVGISVRRAETVEIPRKRIEELEEC